MSLNFLILWPLSFPLLPFAPNALEPPSPKKDFMIDLIVLSSNFSEQVLNMQTFLYKNSKIAFLREK